MNTEPVQKALEMGLSEGRIRAATKNRLDSTGRPYLSVEALVEAVLDGQSNEEQIEEDETNQSSSTIVQEVSRILDTIFNPRASSSSMSQDDEPVQDIGHSTQRIQTTENAQPDEPATEVVKTTAEKVVESVVPVPDRMETQQLSLEEENRKLKDARLCKICMVDEVGVVFLPCGHLGMPTDDFHLSIIFFFQNFSLFQWHAINVQRVYPPVPSAVDRLKRTYERFFPETIE